MTSLVLLIPLSIVILVGAGIALFWAIDHGQFEDMESSALLPMLDGEAATPKAPGPQAAETPVAEAKVQP